MKRFLHLLLLFSILSISLSAANSTGPSFEPPQDLNAPLYQPPIEQTKENDHFMSELISMVATLGLIIALLLIVAWFLKRLMNTRIEQMNVTSSIKIIERRTLSPKSSLYLIECNQKTILIAESHNGITTLSDNLPSTPEEEPPPPSSFQKLLDKS